jgi:hypothetical protein
MSEALTISKERVLEAAAKCPDAKRILQTIFPEAFADSRPKAGAWISESGCKWLVLNERATLDLLNSRGEHSSYIALASLRDGSVWTGPVPQAFERLGKGVL